MKRAKRYAGLVMAMFLAVLPAGCSIPEQGQPLQKGRLTAPVYPEMAPCPDQASYYNEATGEFDDDGYYKVYDAWREDAVARREMAREPSEGMAGFFEKTIPQFLSETEGGNRVYSPINVYLALAMLAETTGGETRGELLELLGEKDVEALRTQAHTLWEESFWDDGKTICLLANSLWLQEKINYKKPLLDILAKEYYASAFQGSLGTEEMDDALRSWINEQTKGLLEEQAEGLKLNPETVLALVSTLYYKANWHDSFSKAATRPQPFYEKDGKTEKETCDFMHSSDAGTYFWGEKFSAVSKGLGEGEGGMLFLLPEEGVAPEELLKDEEAMNFLLSRDRSEAGWENQQWTEINLALPKFDVVSDISLISYLEELGVHKVFDWVNSDFTPLTDEVESLYVSQAQHAARVKVDEEGCEAAAYTVIAVECGAAAPADEPVDFVLDRPFLFAITGSTGLPLFVGVVNEPTGTMTEGFCGTE